MKTSNSWSMNRRAQQVVKNVAICLAAFMGLIALYYCLLPALAENASETDVYVFFDNGLSQYEGKTTDGTTTVVTGSVYSSASDTSVNETLEMKLLSDVIAENSTLWTAVKAQLGDAVQDDGTITNINPANVYVSTTTVQVGNYISFSAWDSGTVYDTVVNFRIDSASREWGYDYVDFQWTSEKTALTYGNNCYYAPPQLMIYRYAAEVAIYSGGPKALRQMIYQHGDTYNTTEYYDANGDGVISEADGDIDIEYDSPSKPEGVGSKDAWVNPQNTYGRTFYDAVLEMEGAFGAPTDVYDLGAASQSANGTTLEGSVALNGDGNNGLKKRGDDTGANKVYHTTATFFDYFSDWELAGNPLSEHVTSYTYDSEDGKDKEEIWSLKQSVNGGVAKVTENFDDLGGFSQLGTTGACGLRTDNKVSSHTSDGSYILQISNRATVQYALPDDATGDWYHASMWVKAGTEATGTITVSLYYELNGTAYTFALDTSTGTWSDDWAELTTGWFTVPAGATNCALRYYSVNTYRLDDFTLQYESTSAIPDDIAGWITIDSDDFSSGSTGDFSLLETEWTTDTVGDTDYAPALSVVNGVLYCYWHNPVVYSADTLSEGDYQVSVSVSEPNDWGLNCVYIYLTTDGTNFTYVGHKDFSDATGTTVSGEVTGTFTLDSETTNVQLYFQTYSDSWENWDTTKGTSSCYYDDFELEYYTESISSSVQTADVELTHGENSSGQKDYAKMMGVKLQSASNVTAGKGMEVFLNIADTVNTNNDGITENGNIIPQGKNAYSNKESYLIEGEIFATGKVQLVAKHYKQYFEGSVATSNRKMTFVSEEVIATYDAGNISISEHFAPPIGANATYLSLVLVDSSSEMLIQNIDISKSLIDLEGTFSEGTNRISYSYQGLAFNEAISRYYYNADADASIRPLYFGSNSWMPGNMRYYEFDRNGQKLFTDDEIIKALASIGCESALVDNDFINLYYGDGSENETGSEENMIHPDGKTTGNAAAYLIPLSRDYWINLFGYGLGSSEFGYTGDGNLLHNPNWEADNEPMGGSNSRGVEDLVWSATKEGILGLADTDIEMPYFNEAFLLGDNEANAVYGDVYEDVDFAFAYNEDSGYYEFDSTKAWYAVRLTQDGTTGKYYMDYYNYSQLVDHVSGETTGDVVSYENDSTIQYPGVAKADGTWYDANGSSQTLYQFYPFNSPDTNDRFATENLMFGMKLDIPFNMSKQFTYNGQTVTEEEVGDATLNGTETSNSMFKFSGDDDVWVYVDGQRVLDIGGTHTAVGGFIDLKNGYGVLGSIYADDTGIWSTTDLSNTEPEFQMTGKDDVIQSLEKAAFAALASLEELAIDPAIVKALSNGAATEWVINSTDSTAEFFDDEYTIKSADSMFFQYRMRRTTDGEYLIDVNIPGTINDDAIAGGTVTFDLTVFEMSDSQKTDTYVYEEATNGTTNTIRYQIINHELTIYYMERGLNSSNFKLAFNFVDNADREVEKSWGDGTASHSDDAILVALYGAKPAEASGTFNLEDTDYSLIRLIGHQALANNDSDLQSSGLASDSDMVDVQFQLDDEAKNSAATISINGMPITEEVYNQLHNSAMALTILVDGVEVQIDSDGSYTNGEFLNISGFETQYCTNDLGTGLVTDAQKRSAIKLHDATATGGSTIRIKFNQVDVTSLEPTPEAGNNAWGFFNNSAWLIEAFGWDIDNATAIPVIARKIHTAQESAVYATDNVTGTSRTLTASEMQIVITNVMRERTNASYKDEETDLCNVQISHVSATAVMPEDALQLKYTQAQNRKLLLRTGSWTNVFQFDYDNYVTDATYKGNTAGYQFPATVLDPVPIDANAPATMIFMGGGTSLGQNITLECVEYSNTFSITDFGYGAPQLYNASNYEWDVDGDGDNDPGLFLLDDSTDWKAIWEGLPSSSVIANVNYDYKYFIRELAILEWDAVTGTYVEKTDENYRTTYYADSIAEENILTPTYFTINNEVVPLYSLDTEEGKVVVSNEEITDATITKAWSGVSDDEKAEVIVDVYVEDPANEGVITLVDSVVIGADNNWVGTIEDILVYNNNQTNPQKLNYYAAEETMDAFTATYNGARVTKTYNGNDIAVYQLNTVTNTDGTETYALTVTNQSSGFVLEIDKYGEDGTTPLEGATFVLYEWTGEGNPEDYTGKAWDTDGDGKWSAEEILDNVGFGLWMPVSDGKTTETQTVDETASVNAAKSVKVMNKVVETATATVSNVNSATTYTTTKKVGSIDAAAKTLSDEQALIINGAGNDYFDIYKGSSGTTASYNGPKNVVVNGLTMYNGVKMEGSTRIEFTTNVKGTITVYASANSGAVTAGQYEVAITDANDNQLDSEVVSCSAQGVFTVISFTLDATGTFKVRKTSSSEQCYIGYIKFTPTAAETTTTESGATTTTTTTSMTAQQTIMSNASLVISGNPGSNNYVQAGQFVYYQAEGNNIVDGSTKKLDFNTTTRTVTINSQSYSTKGLKLQGNTRIGFSLGVAGTLHVYVNSSNASTLRVTNPDGTYAEQAITASSSTVQELTFALTQIGAYSISRNGSQFYVEAIYFEVPEELLPLDNATDAELMMTLMDKNLLKDTHDDAGVTIDPETWYSSELALEIAYKIISYQITSETPWAGTGGWTKENGDGTVYAPGYNNWNQATIDNDITTAQIRYLSKVYLATGDSKCYNSLIAGINFILGDAYVGEYYNSKGTINSGQQKDTGLRYANGGFAQRFDESADAYHCQITFNDDAMVNVLTLLIEIGTGTGDFNFLYGTELATEAITAVHEGVQCILDCQIIVNSKQSITAYMDPDSNTYCGGDNTGASQWEGKYTGWCQQHDPVTLQPGWARAFEPPSISSRETVGVINFLIQYYNSDICLDTMKEVLPRRINAAVDWISAVAIDEKIVELTKCEDSCTQSDGTCRWAETDGVKDTWARFYSLTDGETPIWADREYTSATEYEKNYKSSYNAMSCERRNGYSYIETWGKAIAADPDAYRIPINGTAVQDLIVYPSMYTDTGYVTRYTYNTSGNKIEAWYDYGDFWTIVSNIRNGAAVYGDATYTFANLPSGLIGAEYIRPANASSAANAANALATFRLNTAANLYIPIAEGASLPDAMKEWTKTDVTISVNGMTMTIYSLSLAANMDSATPYSLYSLASADALNYGVFVVVGSSTATEYTTDANGEVSISGLKGDTYYALIEISAPLGYMPLDKPTLFSVFTVTEGENAGIIDTTKDPDVSDPSDAVTMQWDSTSGVAALDADILNDSTHVDLPNTGGSLLSIIFNGMSILIPVLAGVYFLWKRREDPVE